MGDRPALVVDTGTASTKAGFASDDQPRAIFSTAVARPRGLCGRVGKEYYEVFIGDEAESRSEAMQLTRPLEGGLVHSWDDLERVWHHVFYRELRVAPEERPLLLAAVPLCPSEDKLSICEIMFETLNVPCLFLESHCVLSLYASGRTSGVVVDSGSSATHVAPVDDGCLVRCAHSAHPLAGAHVTQHLKQLLQPKYPFTDSWEHTKMAEDIKHKLCYVSKDSCSRHKSYVLPDGSALRVAKEATQCAESLFQPDAFGHDLLSLPDEIRLSVAKCGADTREELMSNVVVCGGNSLLRNFPERLESELRGSDERANVSAAEDRAVYAWLGGSIFAGMADTTQYWLQKKQYEESGMRIVKNKFI